MNQKKLHLLHSTMYSVQLESKKVNRKILYVLKMGFPFYAADVGVALRVDQQIELHTALQRNRINEKSLMTLSDERLLAMLRTLKAKDNDRYAWSEGHEQLLRMVLDTDTFRKVCLYLFVEVVFLSDVNFCSFPGHSCGILKLYKRSDRERE